MYKMDNSRLIYFVDNQLVELQCDVPEYNDIHKQSLNAALAQNPNRPSDE